MAGRKESLERILNERNIHLEQWESQLDIARDPKEKEICKREIREIKFLIAETEAEINSLGDDINANNPGYQNIYTQPVHRMGFPLNEGTKSNGPHDTPVPNVSDPIRDQTGVNEEVMPPYVVNTNGNRPVYRTTGNTTAIPLTANIKLIDVVTSVALVISFIIMASVLYNWAYNQPCPADTYCSKHHLPTYIFLSAAVIASIFSIYFSQLIKSYLPKRGLQLGVSLLLMSLYFLLFYWGYPLFDKEGETISKIILVPLLTIIIGSILLLVDDKDKK